MKEKSSISHKDNKCPLCRKAPKFYEEDFVLNQKRKFSAYCDCNESRIEVTYATLRTIVGDPKEYFRGVALQKWEEQVCKQRMKNPGSKEETGVDADEVWGAVLDAMWDAYTEGFNQNNLIGTDIKHLLERHLNEVL